MVLTLIFASVAAFSILAGDWTLTQSKPRKEKKSHPIFLPDKRNCSRKAYQIVPMDELAKIQKAHSKWVNNPKAPIEFRANFCNAKLEAVDLEMAMLAGANFRKARLSNVIFEKANLTNANFSDAKFFEEINFTEAMLHLANFQDARFYNSNNLSTSLKDAMLYQANFRGADLQHVKDLTQAQINMACVDEKTKLPPTLSPPKRCPATPSASLGHR